MLLAVACLNILLFFRHSILPMIKLETPDGARKVEPGYAALRELLLKRADTSLFDSTETIDYLIQYSGGNPRELLKLLDLEGRLLSMNTA